MGRPKKVRVKRGKYIRRYSDAELNAAVDDAVAAVPEFWVIMLGVDAYMERRRRKQHAAAIAAKHLAHALAQNDFDEAIWGQS